MWRRSSLLVLAGFPLSLRAASSGGLFQERAFNPASSPPSANTRYRLFQPSLSSSSAKPLPLVIYLHGAGAKGDDNQKPLREPIAQHFASDAVQRDNSTFVLVPQCRAGDSGDGRPNNWVKWRNQKESLPSAWRDSDTAPGDQLIAAMAALDDVIAHFPIDQTRIYLAGVSMGASGTWNWARHQPHRFAAILPVCGLSEARHARTLRNLPVWTFQGELDTTVPVQRTRDMVEALRQLAAPIRYTEYPGAGHSIERQVRSEDQLLPWLFAQRKAAQ